MNRVKFIIVENSYLIRKGIVSIINRIDHATVVKELDNLDEINSALNKFKPDFVVINLCLFTHDKNFRNNEIKTDLQKIGIGINPENSTFSKGNDYFREIINVVDKRDEIYRKLQVLIQEKVESTHNYTQQTELSEREKTILKFVAKGFTNKEIADKLFLSAHTVITHRKNITNKLGIKTISGLTIYAILNNIISIDDLK